MRFLENPGLYALMMLLGFWVMFFSIWDVIFNKGWMYSIIAAYITLLFLVFLLVYMRSKLPVVTTEDAFEEFEKTLKGGLYHFKCPTCDGIFAIKKSRSNDKKPVKMTCPDCGKLGIIPETAACIEGEIPEKKSAGVNFKCELCGEGVTIWAEGSEMYPDICLYSCPFCGEQKPMQQI